MPDTAQTAPASTASTTPVASAVPAAPPTPVTTTATAVPQPTGDIAQDITALLADLKFDGAGEERVTNLAHDPEITAAEMAWDKVDSKFKAEQQPAADAESATDPSQSQAQASSTAAADAEGQEQSSSAQPAAAEGADQTAADSSTTAPAIDADDLDDPSLPTVIDITKPRGQQIYAAYKAMRQLAAPPEQGGIGHVPTPEQVGQYFTAHLEIHRLLNDFADPDPKNFITGLERTDPGALDRLAVALPQHILQANPKAYEQLAVPVLKNAIGALVDHAKVLTGTDREHWFNVANSLEYYVSDGKSQLDKSILDKPSDPTSEIEADYNRLKMAESQRLANDRRQATQDFSQTLGKDTHSAVMAAIEHTLTNVKSRVDAKVYSDLVNSVFADVKNSVITNRFAQTAIDNARRNAVATGAVLNRSHWDAHVKAITKTYMQFAQPAISSAVRARMSAYTKSAVAQSQQQQQQQPRPGAQAQGQAQTQAPIRRGAPAGTSQRQPQNPLNPQSQQAGNKTGRDNLTNAERALEQIYQVLQ